MDYLRLRARMGRRKIRIHGIIHNYREKLYDSRTWLLWGLRRERALALRNPTNRERFYGIFRSRGMEVAPREALPLSEPVKEMVS